MKSFAFLPLITSALFFSGCAFTPSSGPLVKDINNDKVKQFNLINVDSKVANELATIKERRSFSQLFPSKKAFQIKTLAPGDTIEVRLWEAPPAVLLGGGMAGVTTGTSSIGSVFFPEQAVNNAGEISIPFAGKLNVKGRTPNEVEEMIVKRLSKKANDPQAMVRLVTNNSTSVAVVGEVQYSTKMPLKASSTLIDALIAAKWVKYPVNKMSIQLTRGYQVYNLPLETLINNPKQQNIGLEPGDIITALYQPLSFTILGSSTKNEEVPFETKGITLAQALARSGGFKNNFADAKGIFLFRFEDGDVVNRLTTDNSPKLASNNKVPVIYQIDFANPQSLFAVQKMPIKNKDFIYVAEAPSVEFKRFLDIVTSTIFSAINLINVTQ